ncbi:MAG TPA: hypothetical protein PKA43_06690 [Candidatus Competibacter phosphatis]|nr:hypothetical protein [Candidatus Competibacter phosphatis]HMR03041.1 hypothetical protein [Candidatus Competibacter phosphatis]
MLLENLKRLLTATGLQNGESTLLERGTGQQTLAFVVIHDQNR